MSGARQWIRQRWNSGLRETVSRWGRRVVVAGVLGYLLYQLTGIGWAEIWRNLPTQPLFYIIFAGMYLGLPVAETFIYRRLWGIPFRRSLPVLIQKRVYNKDVLNYSGEAHLYVWAKNNVNRRPRLILRDIKDNTVISSLTSMSVALVLLGTFLFFFFLPFDSLIPRIETAWLVGGGFCAVLLAGVAIRFRKSVIALPLATALVLFGWHLARLLFVQTLQIFQWAVVMPEVPWSAWFMLLALQIVVNQLPLLPAKDLIVLGASTELSGWLDVSQAGVVGMLLVAVVLDKVANLVLFAWIAWRGRQSGGETAAAQEHVAEPEPTLPERAIESP